MTTPPPASVPLTRWGHTWRLLLAAIPYAISLAAAIGPFDPRPIVQRWIDLGAGAVALACTPLHRRFPLEFAFGTAVVAALCPSAAGASALGLVSIATRRRWFEIAPLVVVSVGGGVIRDAVTATSGAPWWLTLLVTGVGTLIVVLWGGLIGTRRELVATLRWRAETAEREQANTVAAARTAERARIAREMHDVLAHRISLLSMHAGVLAFRDDLSRDEVRQEASVIQTAAKDALDELRGVLGVLRDLGAEPGVTPPLAPPQPMLGDLEDLVEEARGSGARIEVHDSLPGDRSAIPPAMGRHLYRMAQECLTNARKHAPGAPVVLTLSGRQGDQVVLEVRNSAPAYPPVMATSGSRLGLVGLAERATILGGTLEHGPTPEGGYLVRASLPWKESAGGH